MSADQVRKNSGNDEWYTPPEFIEAARQTMGCIDLDPASNEHAQQWIQAKRFFTIEDDGLTKRWKGSCWMNPPYSGKLIGNFVDKMVDSYLCGDVTQACVLTNSATETRWFQSVAMVSQGLCLVSKRIKFIPKIGEKRKTPLQGQVIFYLGMTENFGSFVENFTPFGMVVKCL